VYWKRPHGATEFVRIITIRTVRGTNCSAPSQRRNSPTGNWRSGTLSPAAAHDPEIRLPVKALGRQGVGIDARRRPGYHEVHCVHRLPGRPARPHIHSLAPLLPVPHYLNLDDWPRRPQFEFYSRLDNPFFNVCVEVDVTNLKAWTEASGASFFLASLYASQRATETVSNFRYRLDGDRVRVQDRIVPGCTILREDDTFGFGYFEPAPTFAEWQEAGRQVIEHVRSTKGLDDRPDDGDVLHYSVLPWVSFTSFSHARSYGTDDSVPKIVLGRFTEREERLEMPVSVAVHHGLMDGLHVGRYVERLEQLCAHPEQLERPRAAHEPS